MTERVMQQSFLPLLACVACRGPLRLLPPIDSKGVSQLSWARCDRSYPVQDRIPRFVDLDLYADSFGFQWLRFSHLQLDSYNKTDFSEERFRAITGWSESDLRGKLVVDASCGAGRFAEIVGSKYGARLIAFDLSAAVEACRHNVPGDDVLVVQTSIYDPGLAEAAFDFAYSIGVIQHTPDRETAIRALCRLVKPGGSIGLWIYELNWKCYVGTTGFKYLLRPIVSRWPRRYQMAFFQALVTLCYPVVAVARHAGFVGRVVSRLLPAASMHLHDVKLSTQDLKDWMLLDTFDMYTPAYDAPMHYSAVVRVLEQEGFDEIRRHPHGAIAVTARRPPDPATAMQV